MHVSVVIPTYNRAHCVMNAINSVLRQHGSYEVIVVDDGSSDGTHELFKNINNPALKYYKLSVNKGVNAARNHGVAKSQGEYILLLDSDDELHPDFFTHYQHQPLHPINFYPTIDQQGKKMLHAQGHYTYKQWLQGKIRGEATPLTLKKIHQEYPYDEDKYCFEQIFWNRAIRTYGVHVHQITGRIYNYNEPNRVSNLMTHPSKAKQRYQDYKAYCAEFKKDYYQNHLYAKYATWWAKKAYYSLFSKLSGMTPW